MPDTTEEKNKQINNEQPIFELPEADCEPDQDFNNRLRKAIRYTLSDIANIHADQNTAYIELQNANDQLNNVQKQIDVSLERIKRLQGNLNKKDDQLKILSSAETKIDDKKKLVDAIILIHENDL